MMKDDFVPEPALTAAQVLQRPSETRYADEGRLWQGIPSVAKTPGGRLYVVFYSGMKTEQSGNFTVVTRSDDGGASWRCPELIVEHPDPAVRVFDPCLWLDPLGRLWLIWSQSLSFFDGRDGVWASVSADPDAPEPSWSRPRRIANGVMMNKPAVLGDGTWLFPCAVWACKEPSQPHPELDGERRSNVYASTDDGQTFTLRGGADVPRRSFDEHMVVELRDGRLWMLVRTEYGIGESFSPDGGTTWTPGRDSGIAGPCSRFFMGRLASGRLLLINHRGFTGRNNLTAMVSEDEGSTWLGGLLLDGRDHVSYPDSVQDSSGLISVVYDRERYADREILMASFTEQDVLAGRCVTPGSRLGILVNRATGVPEG